MFNKLLKKYAKNEKGLTLIELLVVIVILGIIAAIAVVSIGGIIGNTKDKAKVTEAVQIINAAKLKHSAEGKYAGTTGWVSTTSTDNPFKGYLSDVKDTSWKVTVDADGKYSITGHDAAPVLLSTNSNTTVVPESDLTSYIDGE